MKQRIRVVGIIEREGKALFLRRPKGRLETVPTYELPSGKIIFGEQPEEAMSRITAEGIKSAPNKLTLNDVVTFVNLAGSSEIGSLYIIYDISLESRPISLNKDRYDDYLWVPLQDAASLQIDEASRSVLTVLKEKIKKRPAVTPEPGRPTEAIVYTDGGSRGNPGPSAIGYVITTPGGEVIDKGGMFIGLSNSRHAEYVALKHGIEKVIEHGYKSANFLLDNLMVVSQMNGLYKVKNSDLIPTFNQIHSLLEGLDSFSFTHISRDRNREADSEVNRVLDQYARAAI